MKYLTTLLLIVLNFISFAQNKIFFGKYNSNQYYIKLNDSLVEFKLHNGSCLGGIVCGNGNYKITDSILDIDIKTPSKSISSTYKINSVLPISSNVKVYLKDYESLEPIPFVTIKIVDTKTNKTTIETFTDEYGCTTLSNIDKSNIDYYLIEVKAVGFDHYKFQLNEVIGKDIDILLRDYSVIHTGKLRFNIETSLQDTFLVGSFESFLNHGKKLWPFRKKKTCPNAPIFRLMKHL